MAELSGRERLSAPRPKLTHSLSDLLQKELRGLAVACALVSGAFAPCDLEVRPLLSASLVYKWLVLIPPAGSASSL